MTNEQFIPYETLSRAEADDIVIADNLPTSLRGLTEDQFDCVKLLVADGYAKGLEVGFSLSSVEPISPAEIMEAYSAGVTEGRKP